MNGYPIGNLSDPPYPYSLYCSIRPRRWFVPLSPPVQCIVQWVTRGWYVEKQHNPTLAFDDPPSNGTKFTLLYLTDFTLQ